MQPEIWDCMLAQNGISLSSFQRRVLDDLYTGHGDARRAVHQTAVARPWPGVVLVSVLISLPLATFVYGALLG